MKKTRIAVTVAGVTLLAGGAWLYRLAEAKEAPSYRLATVERGRVESTVSATGSLGAVRTVQVGTQVSGQVAAIHVDFNDRVKKGQLLARIDPTLQQQAVQDAQAGLERAEAQYAQAKGEYDRNKQLHDAKIVTAAEFATAQSNYSVAQANVKSARVALDRARQNLSYTAIYSPIDGVIVERNVDVGQTVAASLSAPQLFLIANDLSQMQILASVDESDIGQIAEGQPVSFSVQSYPTQKFEGEVRQVRLQSATTDNVVSYTVVVGVENTTGRLLPGMTATVEFLTASADSVLTVPNAALRYRPSADVAAAAAPAGARQADSARAAGNARGQGTAAGARSQSGQAPAQRSGATRQRSGSAGTLWTVGPDGTPTPVRVRAGLSDGQRTQVQGPELREGMQVIVGNAVASAEAATAPASSPFTPQSGGAGRPRF